MKDTRKYLDGLVGRSADVRFAKITARNLDESYDVALLKSGQELKVSAANPNDKFTTGTWVVIGRLAASGNVKGAGDVILSRAPEEQRGLAGSLTDSTTIVKSGAVILGIDPEPIQLTRGGSAVSATIYGVGMTESPVASDPEITLSSIVIGSTEITFDASASVDALDNSDITIHGVTFENAIATKPSTAFTGLYITDSGNGKIYRVDPSTLSLLTTLSGHTSCRGLTWDASYLWTRRLGPSGQVRELVRIRRSDHGEDGTPTEFTVNTLNRFAQANGESRVWVNKSGGIMSQLETYGSQEDKTIGSGAINAIYYDGTYFWVASNQLDRWTRGTDTVDASINPSAALSAMSPSATHLYVLQSAARILHKVNRSTLGSDGSVNLASTASVALVNDLVVLGTNVYVVGRDSGLVNRVWKISTSGLTVDANLSLGSVLTAVIVTDGSKLYVVGNDNIVHRIDPAAMTIEASSSAFDSVVAGTKTAAIIS